MPVEAGAALAAGALVTPSATGTALVAGVGQHIAGQVTEGAPSGARRWSASGISGQVSKPMGAPCAACWIASAVADLGEEPPVVADPDHPAVGAWFDQVVAALLHRGHLERVTVDAPAEVAGVEDLPGAPVFVVDEGHRAYVVHAR